MRVSLLLAREDFGRILEDTLSAHWHERFGREFKVCWGRPQTGPTVAVQQWHGNKYLNFFATDIAPNACMRFIRREYGRSVGLLRRPLQSAYVRLGTTALTRRALSQVAFTVTPPSPDGGKCILMGGNHRLRFLEPEQNTFRVVLKRGAARDYVSNEIAFRRSVPSSIIPRLMDVSATGNWFSEEFVQARGITRSHPDRGRAVQKEAIRRMIGEIVEPAIRYAPLFEVAAQRAQTIGEKLEGTPRLSPRCRAEVGQLTAELMAIVNEREWGRCSTGISWSHGDFQLGNMMDGDDCVWVVDWENVGWRSTGYDPLTLVLQSRRAGQLPRQLERMLIDERHPAHAIMKTWPGIEWGPKTRPVYVALWLLEEVIFHLKEKLEETVADPEPALETHVAEWTACATILART